MDKISNIWYNISNKNFNDSLKFEWDKNKNFSNQIIHKISFSEAQTVFRDKNAIIVDDYNHSFCEERFLIIGRSFLKNILIICFCERDNNTIRIISARKAEKEEKEMYYAKH